MAEYPYRFYRALHRGNEGDVEFYRRAMYGAESVLELGAGDGRIARALVDEGLRVTALERSSEAIHLGRSAPGGDEVQWIEGQMEHFELGERFDRIIAPYTAMFCLLDSEALLGCLRAVRMHLERDGLFIFDVWPADDFHAEGEVDQDEDEESDAGSGKGSGGWRDDWQEDELAPVEVDGVRYRVFESSRWDRAAQLLDVRYRYEPEGGGEPVEGAIPQRYFLVPEILRALEDAGLFALVLHGGFDQRAYDEDSERLVVTAARRDSTLFTQ